MTTVSENLVRAQLAGFKALLTHEGLAEKYWRYDLSAPQLGKRESIRTALDAVVDCRVVGGKSFLGRAKDIGEGGMAMVIGLADVRVGDHVILVTVLPPSQDLLKLPGRVHRVCNGSLDVDFWLLDAQERSMIAAYQRYHRMTTSPVPASSYP